MKPIQIGRICVETYEPKLWVYRDMPIFLTSLNKKLAYITFTVKDDVHLDWKTDYKYPHQALFKQIKKLIPKGLAIEKLNEDEPDGTYDEDNFKKIKIGKKKFNIYFDYDEVKQVEKSIKDKEVEVSEFNKDTQTTETHIVKIYIDKSIFQAYSEAVIDAL